MMEASFWTRVRTYFNRLERHNPRDQPFVAPPWQLDPATRKLQPLYARLRFSEKRAFLAIAWLMVVLGYFGYFNAFFACGLALLITLHWLYRQAWRASGAVVVREVDLPVHVEERQAFTMTVTIENRGQEPVHDVIVFIHNDFSTASGLWRHVPALSPGERFAVRLKAVADCGMGEFSVGPIYLSVADSLGVNRLTVCEGETTCLQVYPERISLDHFPAEMQGRASHTGSFELPISGHSTNFLGLRQWRPGDSIRHICWARSQRVDELLVREFEAIAATDAILFVDHLPLGHSQFKGLSSMEAMRDALLAVIQYLDEHQIRTRVITSDWDTGVSCGTYHTSLVRQLTASLTANAERTLQDLLSQHVYEIPSSSLVVLFFTSGGFQVEQVFEQLIELHGKGVECVLIGFDSVAYAGAVEREANLRADQVQVVDQVRTYLAQNAPSPELCRLLERLAKHTYLLGPGLDLADSLSMRQRVRGAYGP